MKGIDILCASQAATAICMMDEGSSSSSNTIHLGRAIDRYNPIIRDSTRTNPKSSLPPRTPCSSSNQPPISPKSRNHKNIIINNTSTTTNPTRKAASKGSSSSSSSSSSKRNSIDQKRKTTSTTNINSAISNNNGDKQDSNINDHGGGGGGGVKKGGWGCRKPGDFISPPGSSRYLLSDRAFFNVLSDFDPILNLAQSSATATATATAVKKKEEQSSSSSSSVQLPLPVPVPVPPPSSSRSPDQVVVLRVSLHCKGCERKMRKHISRMEGVTSFNIDFAAKKLTVVGDVTPLSVLASVSKVKNAQLLTPTTTSSSAPPVASVPSEIKKFNAVAV